MDVELRPDFPVTDEACLAATGKTLAEWSALLIAMPEIDGKRREAINWLWDQTGRSPQQAWWGTTIYVEHERRLGRVQKDGRPEGYNICVTKSVTAPAETVLKALVESLQTDRIEKVREGRDAKGFWQTDGTSLPVGVEATVKEASGKVAVNVMFKRIDTREETDGPAPRVAKPTGRNQTPTGIVTRYDTGRGVGETSPKPLKSCTFGRSGLTIEL